MRLWSVAAAWISCQAIYLGAQSCPSDDAPSAAKQSVLSGTVRFYNELRDWLGLALNSPVCGQKIIQLTFIEGDASLHFRQAMALDGCKVTVTGLIEVPISSYYSAALYMADGKLEPDPSCHPKPVPADLSASPIQDDVQSFQATVTLNLETNKPMNVTVRRTDGQTSELDPWQAYIAAGLNGSREMLWVTCRNGFSAKSATTLADGHQGKSNDRLAPDTLGLAIAETGPSNITIRCVSSRAPGAPSKAH